MPRAAVTWLLVPNKKANGMSNRCVLSRNEAYSSRSLVIVAPVTTRIRQACSEPPRQSIASQGSPAPAPHSTCLATQK